MSQQSCTAAASAMCFSCFSCCDAASLHAMQLLLPWRCSLPLVSTAPLHLRLQDFDSLPLSDWDPVTAPAHAIPHACMHAVLQDDFDIGAEEEASLDVKDRPEVQEKLERRIRSVEVKIITPPRPGVFAGVCLFVFLFAPSRCGSCSHLPASAAGR